MAMIRWALGDHFNSEHGWRKDTINLHNLVVN